LTKTKKISYIELELRILKEWVKANNRRIEELEASAFQLADVEEVLIVAFPKKEL